jgi:hypothetical protein
MDVDETASTGLDDDVVMGEKTLPSDEVTQHPGEPIWTASTDLIECIPRMRRILDLVSEQRSGGLGKSYGNLFALSLLWLPLIRTVPCYLP